MDETYVGGKPAALDRAKWVEPPDQSDEAPGRQKWADKKTVPVFGMVERDGKVRAKVVPSTQGPTLMGHIKDSVKPEAVVYTDDAKVYRRLPMHGFEHHSINHSEKVYVSGNVHTQTIEGFWSQVKRGINGVHHSVSRKYLQCYLNEYVWRFNHRNDGRAMFFTLALRSAFPTAD